MPSVIINNLFKVNELLKLSNDSLVDSKTKNVVDFSTLNRNILFERKIIQIKCKYQVINQFAKQNYFLQLNEGTGWDIYWTDRQFLSPRVMKSLLPYQRINYFPGMNVLTNKQKLSERLNQFRALFPDDYDFFPPTWIVNKISQQMTGTMETAQVTGDALQMFAMRPTEIGKDARVMPGLEDQTQTNLNMDVRDISCLPLTNFSNTDEKCNLTCPNMNEKCNLTCPNMNEKCNLTCPNMNEKCNLTCPNMNEKCNLTSPNINEKCYLTSSNPSNIEEKWNLTSPNMNEKCNLTSPNINEKCNLTSPNLSNLNEKCNLTSPNLSTKNEKYNLTSPNLSTKNEKCNLTSPNLSTKNEKYNLTSPNLSTKNEKCNLTSPNLSNKNEKCNLTSPNLSNKNEKCNLTSPNLSTKHEKCNPTPLTNATEAKNSFSYETLKDSGFSSSDKSFKYPWMEIRNELSLHRSFKNMPTESLTPDKNIPQRISPLRDISNRKGVAEEVLKDCSIREACKGIPSKNHSENIENTPTFSENRNVKQNDETKSIERKARTSRLADGSNRIITEAPNDETKSIERKARTSRLADGSNRIITEAPNDETNNRLRSLGIKSNGFFQTNLRSTKIANRTKQAVKSPGIVLFKDNVRTMVMQLDRNAPENSTSRKGRKDETYADEGTSRESPSSTVENVDTKESSEGIDVECESANESDSKEKTESDAIYILKPCDGCQGKGIKLALNNNIEQIVNNMEFDSMICQRYIPNPLLWNGYKFDIRFYVLVTSLKQLRIYVYNDGIVRLATEKYGRPSEANVANLFMHLTNYSINKASENFREDFSKQSFEQLNRFLLDRVDTKVLYGKINDLIVKTILAGYAPLVKEYSDTFKHHMYREACFQLLGFDILLDSNCKPYLLEVNRNASLKRPTPVDKAVKTKLTRDLFSILNLNENRLRGDILRDNLNYNTYRKRYVEYEMENRGEFTMIYPCADVEKYAKFIGQEKRRD